MIELVDVFDGMEKSMLEGMINKVVHGYSPGSCTTYMFEQKFPNAIQAAHPMNPGMCKMYMFVQMMIPNICCHESWLGFINETPSRRMSAMREAEKILTRFVLMGDPKVDAWKTILPGRINPWSWMNEHL